MNLTLRLLGGELAILRLPSDAVTPAWLSSSPAPLVSMTRTAHELSIVCPSSSVPSDVAREAGWRAFTIEDKLDFSAVGILASILNPLSEAGINILSLSTFNTDYVLVRATALETATAVLRQKFEIIE